MCCYSIFFKFLVRLILLLCIISSAEAYADILGDPFAPFSSADEYAKAPFGINDQGILYYDYKERYGGLGKYENPTFVANYANALYRDYLVKKMTL